jgi:hypothetical protein
MAEGMEGAAAVVMEAETISGKPLAERVGGDVCYGGKPYQVNHWQRGWVAMFVMEGNHIR